MQLDQDLAVGWHPPGLDERELHDELWGLTRAALRNWLTSPPLDASPEAGADAKDNSYFRRFYRMITKLYRMT